MVGKTTLDRYLTTPGEMEEISEDDSTTHNRILKIGKFKMPKPTSKRVSWQGEKRVVYSADIGGQERFWNLWIEDMTTRNCEAIVTCLTIEHSRVVMTVYNKWLVSNI